MTMRRRHFPQGRVRLFASLVFCFILLTSVSGQERPAPNPQAREADLFEIIKLDPTIRLDVRYARSDNFVGKQVYPEARAFLQRPAAEAVVRVHRKLRRQGLGLVIFDGYRPWSITKLFWEVTPPEKRMFVANPKNGSRHNRGCAVDLSIFDLKTGKHLPMPSEYDEFTERASPEYAGGTEEETRNRELLRKLMEAEGFTVNANEWWHFDYKGWPDYDIYDVAFSEVRNLDAVKGLSVRKVMFETDGVSGEPPRETLALKAGEVFEAAKLDAALKTLNSTGRFKRVQLNDVSWFPDRSRGEVDFKFFLKKKKMKPAR